MGEWSDHSEMSSTVRKLAAGEREKLVAAIDRVCDEGLWMATQRYRPTPDWERAMSQVDPMQHLILVGAVGEELTGWCRIFPEPGRPDLRIATLGIGLLPNWRDQGIGTRMLRESLAWARSAGLRQIRLSTRRDNLRAIHVFRKCGFVPDEDSVLDGGFAPHGDFGPTREDRERLDMALVLGED